MAKSKLTETTKTSFVEMAEIRAMAEKILAKDDFSTLLHHRYAVLHAKKLIDLILDEWKEYFPSEEYEELKKISHCLDEQWGLIKRTG